MASNGTGGSSAHQAENARVTTTPTVGARQAAMPSPFTLQQRGNTRVDERVDDLLNQSDSDEELYEAEEDGGDDTNALCAFINDDKNVTSEERIPYILMIAKEVVDGFSVDSPPYSYIKKRQTVKPTVKLQKKELRRRDPNVKGLTNKKLDQLFDMMKTKLPLTDAAEIAWIKKEEENLREIFQRKYDEDKEQRERDKTQVAARKIDRLRLVECLVVERCRPLFLQTTTPMNRQQLDGRNSQAREPDFYDVVCEIFNDPLIEFDSRVIPDWHEKYAESFKIKLSDFRLTRDKAKEMIAHQRVRIVKICSNWEASGNGEGQRAPSDQDWGHYDASNVIDGASPRSFMQAGDTSDLLYWWHVLDEYQLLHFTASVFTDAVAASADHYNELEPPKKKMKQEDDYRKDLSKQVGELGVGVKSNAYAAINRQIRDARSSQFELQMKIQMGDVNMNASVKELITGRIAEFEEEITRLKNMLHKVDLTRDASAELSTQTNEANNIDERRHNNTNNGA